jgi:colicin import membrane protein
MTARSSNAFLCSALLHCGFIVLLLLLAYGVGSSRPDAPKVFELVAGAGDNYGATVAPALGVPGGIKLKLAAMPTPVVEDQPAPEQPSPVQPVAVSARVVKASMQKPASTKKADAIPNFTKMLERAANRKAARLEAKYKKQLEAEEKEEEREESLERKAAQANAAKAEKTEAEGIREGVVGGSTENKSGGAGGKALSREDGALLDGYFALLKARIKENFQGSDDVSNALTARLEFYVAADGSLSEVQILRSSGNADFDQSVLEAFHRTSPIGPRPDGKGETVTMEFDLREDEQN